MIWRFSLIVFFIAIVFGSVILSALAFIGSPMLMSGGGGFPTSVAPLSASVADNAASGTSVANLSCTTSDGSNSGCTFQVTDPQGYLKVVGNTLETTGAAMTDGTYSNILLQATKNGVTYPASGGGGTIACAIGPAYQGTVPAGAHSAGFDTCAANWDFTQFTSLSQWLDCAGATTPILYNIPGASGNGSDCTAYSMVVDGGANAVQMRVPTGTAAIKAVGMNPINDANTAGQLFPSTKYIEIRARLGTNEISTCVSPNNCDMQGIFYYIPNIGASSNPWGEWDDFECFFNSTNLNCKATLHVQNFTVGFSQGLVRWDTVGAGETGYVGVQADPTTWHTISIRMVSDGAGSLDGTVFGHVSWCWYLDNVQKACRFGNYANAAGSAQDTFQRRQFPTMQNVMDQTETLPGNLDFIIQRVSLWECSGWKAATPLTLNGNNCLNSTADVTGKLTGTP